MLRLDLASLTPDAPVAFTIDVDDTMGAREITVARSEILGATVIVENAAGLKAAIFDDNAMATVAWSVSPS